MEQLKSIVLHAKRAHT